ncbi:exosortase/archaeosortase family protein [Pedobacter sp. CG_S7]|uniref:glycosyltransferase n=1 Tax=Pedobacter sp. CG_S7 TaxID=3143930 RepID=UPI003392A1F2
MSTEFSFIILTLNEEQHLPKLLESIAGLSARTFVLDSGSTDKTIQICEHYKVITAFNVFENHPKQWNVALNLFEINTPWVIGLDADQVITPELFQLLLTFKNEHHLNINGIYFNRKNIFKGKWIKFGGYYPKYLLKMFRYNVGYSDLNENMDHKFQVTGKTIIWKRGHLLEENLKENHINFWIEKHNRYSDLLAIEEIERMQFLRKSPLKPNFWGSPNERNASLKELWWKLPHYTRPILYFSYRMFLLGGILDGKTGVIYHFLQGFWFRLIVDIKIEEKLNDLKKTKTVPQLRLYRNDEYLRFLFLFPTLFLVLYFFNLAFIGFTIPGGYYIQFLDQYLNYINLWRYFNITTTANVLNKLGYEVYIDTNRLHVQGRAGFILVYSCLGYGILSLFGAFVLSYPKTLKNRLIYLTCGVFVFQLLNITRFVLTALYWKPAPLFLKINSHEIFNWTIYAIIAISTYLWLNDKKIKP